MNPLPKGISHSYYHSGKIWNEKYNGAAIIRKKKYNILKNAI